MVLRLVVTAFCGAVATSSGSSAAPPLDRIFVDPATGHYVDSHGRVRIFHGVNVVYKKWPWHPEPDRFSPMDSLDPITMQNLSNWGFNVVRLGVMWPGAEPEQGKIDHDYLATVSRLAQTLADHGVHTILDLHQDVGSRRFCGEGFPEYYIDAMLQDQSSRMAGAQAFPGPFSPLRKNASGFPEMDDCLQRMFLQYYFTDQVGAMWEELYKPGTAMNDGFLRFWQAVASTFKDATHVLAYELLNEPSGFGLDGNATKSVPLSFAAEVFTNRAETTYLAPLYKAAAKVIRATGAAQPILYEATVAPKMFSTGVFPAPPLGDDSQQGLSYHIYCAPGDGDNILAGVICGAAQDVFAETYYPFLQKFKVAGFMTEFGAVSRNKAQFAHLDRLLDSADRNYQSWAYWQLKYYEDFTTIESQEALWDKHGKLEKAKLKTISRTYAPAISGRPVHMRFDPATAAFDLVFVSKVTGLPTEIYLNEELHYPRGYTTVLAAPKACPMKVISPAKNRLHLVAEEARACGGQRITFRLRAKLFPVLHRVAGRAHGRHSPGRWAVTPERAAALAAPAVTIA